MNKGELNIKSSDLTSSEELNISYEEIDTSKLVYQKQTDNIMLIITIIFGGFFTINLFNPDNYKDDGWFGVGLFLFMVTLFSAMITYVKSKNLVLIPTMNNGYIEILKAKPNQKQFDEFLSELTIRITTYLKSKYGTLDFDLPTEPQLMNLSWLKDREIITLDEFENLKKQLINNGKGNSPVGFNK
ncbi:hypothetical protein FB2170_01477 [Maribacter sp. HTCC2170]|nr:hypothetical protein FB2170_01477 [Maribacter sp. HTCC2170]